MADPRNPLSFIADNRGGRGGPSGVPASVYQPLQELYGGITAAPAVNQGNLDYLRLGIPNYGALTQTESGNIASLLHPTEFTDQQRLGAEMAVASGTAGSGFADANTLKLTEDERIRRMLLGSQLLSGAVNRLPAPFNPAALLGRGIPPTDTKGPGVTYRGGPGGGPPGTPNALKPGGPPPNPPGAPGMAPQSGVMQYLMSQINPAPAIDPMTAWRTSIGRGPTDPNVNPITGMVDWNTEGGQAVDAYGQPINYNPVFTGNDPNATGFNDGGGFGPGDEGG